MTSITITTHGKPVQVVAEDRKEEDGAVSYTNLGTVPPHSETSPDQFSCRNRTIRITELASPEAA